MILPKDQALVSAKESKHYFIHLYQKAKTPITITRPEGDSIMYLPQSRQISSLKKRSIMTTHQQRRRGTQISALAISSIVSQWTWYQLADIFKSEELV